MLLLVLQVDSFKSIDGIDHTVCQAAHRYHHHGLPPLLLQQPVVPLLLPPRVPVVSLLLLPLLSAAATTHRQQLVCVVLSFQSQFTTPTDLMSLGRLRAGPCNQSIMDSMSASQNNSQ